jgi:hypothetical protein
LADEVHYEVLETTLVIAPSINAKLVEATSPIPLVVETANPPGPQSTEFVQDLVQHGNSKGAEDIVDVSDGFLAPEH